MNLETSYIRVLAKNLMIPEEWMNIVREYLRPSGGRKGEAEHIGPKLADNAYLECFLHEGLRYLESCNT
jgi:hypothetical protein